jgi:serine/threonine-protein kinase RsbW
MLRVEVPLDLAAIAATQDQVQAWLDGEGVSPSVSYRVRLVAEELLANLVMHGRFAGDRQPAWLALRLEGGAVELTLDDAAEPFDPRSTLDPQLPPALEGGAVGGLGLGLVRRMAEIVDYSPMATGWNRTRIRVAPSADV